MNLDDELAYDDFVGRLGGVNIYEIQYVAEPTELSSITMQDAIDELARNNRLSERTPQLMVHPDMSDSLRQMFDTYSSKSHYDWHKPKKKRKKPYIQFRKWYDAKIQILEESI